MCPGDGCLVDELRVMKLCICISRVARCVISVRWQLFIFAICGCRIVLVRVLICSLVA